MSEEGVLHMALLLADLQANTNTIRASVEFGGRVVWRKREQACETIPFCHGNIVYNNRPAQMAIAIAQIK